MSTTSVIVNNSQAPHTFDPGVESQSIIADLSVAEIRGVVTIVFVFSSVGVLENFVTVLFILRGEGYLEAASNIFLLSLATADFLLCAIPTPLFVYSHYYHWIFKVTLQTSIFFALATVGSIFLSTVDRMASILLSLRYVSIMTVRRSAIMVATLWLSVISIGALQAINESTAGVVYRLMKYLLMIFILVIFLMYIYMYNKSRKHKILIRKQRVATAGETKEQQMDFRSLRTIFMLAGTFVLGWLPLTLVLLLTDREGNARQFYHAFALTAPLTLINASLDPVIYFFRKEDFRRRFLRGKKLFFLDWFGRISATTSRRLCYPCSNRVEPV